MVPGDDRLPDRVLSIIDGTGVPVGAEPVGPVATTLEKNLVILARIAALGRSARSGEGAPAPSEPEMDAAAAPASSEMNSAHPADSETETAVTISGRLRSAASKSDEDVDPGITCGTSGRGRWGDLIIERLLGKGGFGRVYCAYDPRLDRRVALKLLRPDPHGRLDPDEMVVEGRLLARVRHPHVVTVYGADERGGQIGIWMELIQGRTIEQIVVDHGPMSAREAAMIGADVAQALSAVHSSGIIHQDVKARNVMREEGGRVLLMDFGAGADVHRRDVSGGIRGTPSYMAPEVLSGGTPSVRSDLYSLGVLLYHLVTGRLPQKASSLAGLVSAHARGEMIPLRQRRADLPLGFVEVVERCLAADPAKRFPTAAHLEAALAGSGSILLPEPPRAVRRRSRSPATGGTSAAKSGTNGSAAAASDRQTRGSLPVEYDTIFGRESDLKDLEGRLAAGSRLVTLLGAAGMGKTRLAIHFGWRSASQWPGGVWFCDLTEARSAEEIGAALGRCLGIPLDNADPLEQLGHAIAARGRCLLLLDNFETIATHAGVTVGRWLRRAPDARFLITSRQRLRLVAEEVFDVGPLSPESGMQLLMERARRHRSAFDPGEDEGRSLREIVSLTEGMPLAIELTAARLRVLTATQLEQRMRERLRLLVGGETGRHESLRAAIDGSWELLSPWERAAWAQCSVFEGGFTLEAAEAVLDVNAWAEAPWIVDVVQSLADKSLLRVWMPPEASPPGSETRFSMFASLHEYAREKLAQEEGLANAGSGPAAVRSAEARHGAWFARFGSPDSFDALDGPEGALGWRKLEVEYGNLAGASHRARARGEAPIAAETFVAMGAIAFLQGPVRPAIELGREILDTPLTELHRSRVLAQLGRLEWEAGLLPDARGHLEAALAAALAAGNLRQEALVHNRLGEFHRDQGRVEEARFHLETGLALSRKRGERRSEGIAVASLGSLCDSLGRFEEAQVYYESALAIYREVGNRRLEAVTLGNLGNLRARLGRMVEARADCEAALAMHRALSQRRSEAICLGSLAVLAHVQGRLEEARQGFTAALRLEREIGDRLHEGRILLGLGEVCIEEGRIEEARAFCESARAIHGETGDRPFEGALLETQAGLALLEGRLEAARAQAELALVIARETNRRSVEGDRHLLLGRAHLKESRWEEAHRDLQAALTIHRELGERRSVALDLATSAALSIRRGLMDAAADELAESEAILRVVSDPNELAKCLCLRAELEAIRGDGMASSATLGEAEVLATEVGAGPQSSVMRRLARTRRALLGGS